MASTDIPQFDPKISRSIVKSPHGFNGDTEAKEVARTFAALIAGKTILITGVATGGLGGEVTLALASVAPAELIVSGRSQSRVSAIVSEINSSYPNVKVTFLELDLSSLSSVRKAAGAVQGQIDVIINNAGVMAIPYGLTKDGFEMQFGTNHLGHFVLTNTLLKEGKIREGGRIVNVSSDGHRLSPVRFNDPNFKEDHNKWKAYGQSKTANMLFSLELAKRLKARNILSFSLHPGVINTNLGRSLEEDGFENLVALDKEGGYGALVFKFVTLQQGCASQIVAAFDPSIANYNGSYLEECTISKPYNQWASDPEAAAKLWTLSEELVGEKFDF